jgi:hypothetical protein
MVSNLRAAPHMPYLKINREVVLTAVALLYEQTPVAQSDLVREVRLAGH